MFWRRKVGEVAVWWGVREAIMDEEKVVLPAPRLPVRKRVGLR